MGITRKQKLPESPKSLVEFADSLDQIANSLRDVAEAMLLAGVPGISVRYAPGSHKALREKLKPFGADADKKAEREGANVAAVRARRLAKKPQ